MDRTNVKKGVATIWVIVIAAIVGLGIGGGGSYYYLNSQEEVNSGDGNLIANNQGCEVEDDSTESSATESSVDTSSWKTLEFENGGSIKYPIDWKITSPETSYSFTGVEENYEINADDKGNSGWISMYNIDEWLQGPSDDEPYSLSKSDRASAYQTIQDIYSSQKLTPEIRLELNQLRLEFFTYSNYDRTDVNYAESFDGFSRGFTMVNAYGQDIGLSIMYVISLFNKDQSKVIRVSMPLTSKYSEIKKLVDRYGDYDQEADELTRIDRSIHQDFMQLMLSDRADLSFGDYLNQIDAVAKSIIY